MATACLIVSGQFPFLSCSTRILLAVALNAALDTTYMQSDNMQKKKEAIGKWYVDSSAKKGASVAIKTLIVAVALMAACSIFKPATIEELLKNVAERIAEQHELTVDVFNCNDYEIDRVNRKLLMLCEADLK